MRDFLHDLIFPHQHNNFRSKLLHHKIILFLIIFLFSTSFLLSTIRTNLPQVLGVSSDVTIQQLLDETNKKRQENGAGALIINEKLDLAAEAKANNVFTENYWAHNSPSGKTPWFFIKNSGYPYIYAGENLARGFNNSQEVVNAWMNSPSHRENMLSQRYTDVGFAIKKGKLNGEETVLIVEILGSTTLGGNPNVTVLPPSSNKVAGLPLPPQLAKPALEGLLFSKGFVVSVAILFMTVLVIDMIVVEKKRITRFVGHNLDHIFFFGAIVLIVFAIARGYII